MYVNQFTPRHAKMCACMRVNASVLHMNDAINMLLLYRDYYGRAHRKACLSTWANLLTSVYRDI